MKGDEFKMENLEFGKGSVPVKIAAKVYGKDSNWVRAGIITGFFYCRAVLQIYFSYIFGWWFMV